MFGLGFWELLLILFLVFIFVGPESFPKFSSYIAKFLRNLQDIRRDVEDSIYTDLNEDTFLKKKLESNVIINDIKKEES